MKTLDIEALLRWAYRDELPKAAARGGARLSAAPRSGWGGMERFGELLAVVQEPDILNRYGLFPDFMAAAEPHPDAVLVGEAVERLGLWDFEMPESWNPIADLGEIGPDGPAAITRGLARLTLVDATGRTRLRRPVARLVIRAAILGRAPEWEADAPVRKVVSSFGKPRWFRREVLVSNAAFGPATYEVEVDGFDHKRRMPAPGAYQKHVWEPDPAEAVAARAEYELWHAALGALAEDLAPELAAHRLSPFTRSPRPWEVPDPAPAGRVLAGPLLLHSRAQRALANGSALVWAGESPPGRARRQKKNSAAA